MPKRLLRQKNKSKVKNEGDEDEQEKDDEDDDAEDSDDGSWVSEDDPDRLWCICKQPHNNRFMICCDQCLDWFHGKCVGITKQKGKDMEEAGLDWRCPNCLKEDEAGEKDAEEEMEEAPQEEDEPPPDDEIQGLLDPPPKENIPVRKPNKNMKRTKSIDSKNKEPEKEKKIRQVCCHMCTNPPRENSIYCGEECIKAHAKQALKLFNKDGKSSKGKTPVVVIDPKTNTLLNGPNAPTESSLEGWLQSHTSYHVVMPSMAPSNKFYSQEKMRRGPKLVEPHREAPDSKHKTSEASKSKSSDNSSKTPTKSPPKPPRFPSINSARKGESTKDKEKSKEEIRAEVKASLQRVVSRSDDKVTPKKERRQSESHTPRAPVRRKTVNKEPEISEPKQLIDNKSLRSTVQKGLREALEDKMAHCDDIQMEIPKLHKIAEDLEIAMFGTFGDVGFKYKNKYRSLTYNIKDPKNDGLFRRIVTRDLQPIEVVALSADQYASKELAEWRQSENKKDLDAIKANELDMIALGNTFVMKTHKGEQVIEKPDEIPNTENVILQVPDEMGEPEKDVRELGEGPKTFEHPNHGDVKTEPLCDVCNGKKTLEAFVKEKIDREAKLRSMEKKKDRSKDGHKSSSRHRHSSSHRDDKDRHSSSRHSYSKHHSSSKHSSKGHSSSSHKHSSGDKKDRDKHVSGDKDGSSRHKESSRHKNSSGDKDSSRHKHVSGDKESSRHKHSSSSSSRDKDRHRDKAKDRHKSGSDKSKEQKQEVPVVGSSQEKVDTANADKEKVQDKLRQAEDIIKKARQETSKLSQKYEEKLANVSSGSLAMPDEPSFSPDLNEDVDIDIDIPLYDDKPMGVFQRTSSTEAEVSSTVVIKTPEHSVTTPGDDHPAVWEGQVIMQDVTKFSVTAHQVAGTSDYLNVDLSKTMTLVGRIPPKVCWDYIIKIKQNPLKEILVLRLQPQNNDEKVNYIQFFSYLQTRSRFGVVGNASRQTVKDCYIMPLSSTDPVPACLLPFDGPGLEASRANILLAILVRTRRKRPGDPPTPALPVKSAKVHKPPPPPLPTDDSTSYLPTDKRLAPPPPSTDADDIPYSPEDNEPYSPPEEDNVDYRPSSSLKAEAELSRSYTPTSAADSGSFKPTESTSDNLDDVTPVFQQTKMSDSSGGFTEKLAKLQAEVAAKKAELAMREASLGINQKAAPPSAPVPSVPRLPDLPVAASAPSMSLGPEVSMPAFSTDVMEKNKKGIDLAALPSPITNILFGGGPPGPLNKTPLPSKLPMPPLPLPQGSQMGSSQMGSSQIPQIPPVGPSQIPGSFPQHSQSSLRGLSDADLIAAAQSMDIPTRGPLPPPGPGMPGNLQGQGIGNVALMEQMEKEAQREEERRSMGSYKMGWEGSMRGSDQPPMLTDAELISKAQAMDLPARGSMPVAGPGMSGRWDSERGGQDNDLDRGRGGSGGWRGRRDDRRDFEERRDWGPGRDRRDYREWEKRDSSGTERRGNRKDFDSRRDFDNIRDRDRRDRERRERDWEEDEERDWRGDRGRGQRSPRGREFGTRKERKDWEERRGRSRSRERLREREWEDESSRGSADVNRRTSNFSRDDREGSPALDTIPLKIPSKVDGAKSETESEKSKGVVDVHADVAAQLANIDAQFKLPGVDMGSPVSEGSPRPEDIK